MTDDRARSVELHDLSRMLDRLHSLEDEVEDMTNTKIGNELDKDLEKELMDVNTSLAQVVNYVESRIGDPANYKEDVPNDA